ncbi:MAG: hypothetical protein U0X76_09895 [Bacteroidia bacterium]
MDSLAIAGEVNQFYSSINANRIVKVCRGTNWNVLFTDTIPLFNAAGNRLSVLSNYARFKLSKSYRTFDGTNETLIWYDTTTYMAIADLAVDDQGNVIFFTGSSITEPDTMRVFSPRGIQLGKHTLLHSAEKMLMVVFYQQ